MNRRNLIKGIGAIATGTTITALAGCTGNGNGEDSEPEGIPLRFMPSESFEEHVTFETPTISPENPENEPDGMVIGLEMTVNSAPNDASCLGTRPIIEAFDEHDGIIYGRGHDWERTFEVGETHVTEYFIPAPMEESQDADLDVPERIEFQIDTIDDPDCE